MQHVLQSCDHEVVSHNGSDPSCVLSRDVCLIITEQQQLSRVHETEREIESIDKYFWPLRFTLKKVVIKKNPSECDFVLRQSPDTFLYCFRISKWIHPWLELSNVCSYRFSSAFQVWFWVRSVQSQSEKDGERRLMLHKSMDPHLLLVSRRLGRKTNYPHHDR